MSKSLEVKVLSASGIVGGTGVWDKTDFDGYVKVEMRGGDGVVKARTAAVKSVNQKLYFEETMTLPIPAGAEEVRLKICKEKKRGIFGSSVVIANAGIYLKDLLRFVPIEKDFNLFKPTDKTDGGTIKLYFDHKGERPATKATEKPKAEPLESAPASVTPSNVADPPTPSPAPKAPPPAPETPIMEVTTPEVAEPAASASADAPESKGNPIAGLVKAVIALGLAGGAAAIIKKNKDKSGPPPPSVSAEKKGFSFGSFGK